MKTIILVALFGCAYLNADCQDFKPSSNGYIEIMHTGAEQVNIPTVFISTQTIHFPLRRSDTVGLYFHGNVTPEWIDNFLKYKYQNIVTDHKTYTVLRSFLNGKPQQKYYAKKPSENYGVFDDYEITVDSKRYHVYYKYLHFFFNMLIYKLSSEKCDPVVIEKLKFYRVERFRK